MTVDQKATINKALTDAGRTLMMLPYPARSRPGEACSAWPDILQNFWDVFGHAEQADTEERREIEAQMINRVRVMATTKQITQLDVVLGYLWFISVPRERRVIVARMLTHPMSDKPVYSWYKIAKTMGMSERTIRRWHNSGLDAIILGLAPG